MLSKSVWDEIKSVDGDMWVSVAGNIESSTDILFRLPSATGPNCASVQIFVTQELQDAN